MWTYYPVNINTPFYNIFKKVIKTANKNEIKIKCKFGLFKFIFDWQDNDICGIDVYKGKEINLTLHTVATTIS